MTDRKNPADSAQSRAVLEALRSGPKTTWQLGYGLRICCVTKRISELRAAGHQIEKTERKVEGKRIVTYSLRGQMTLGLEDAA